MPEARADGRVLQRWLLRGSLLLLLLLLPWPGAREISDSAFRAIANLALRWVEFGDGDALGHGRATLEAESRARITATDDGAAWDTRLRLHVTGVSGDQSVYVSPRRLAFLPCCMLLSVLLAAPLSLRRKLIGSLVALPLLLCAGVGSVMITAAWIFARVPGLVYASGAATRTAAIDLAYRALVVPTGNRIILPLLLGAALIALELGRASPARG